MKEIDSWNTWDVRCLNGVMKVPQMAEIRVGIYDENKKKYLDELLWDKVSRFGHHEVYGKYFDLDLKYEDFKFNMEFASSDDIFVYKVTPIDKVENIKFFVAGMLRWNSAGKIDREDDTISFTGDDYYYNIKVIGPIDNITPINVSHQGILLDSTEPIYICCNNNMSISEMNIFLAHYKKHWMNHMVKGAGLLNEAPEAIIKGLIWNTIYEPIKKRLCTPVSRAWCIANGTSFGSYVLFEWDTFFCSLLSSLQDKELAYQEVSSILQEITKDGFIPNFGSQIGGSTDRAQPPVGSYCVLKLYKQFGDIELLQDSFESLLIFNSWWLPNRDGNKDGLLEWGSNADKLGEASWWEAHNIHAANYESGLDNSPMYDGVKFNNETNTMELIDVGLNSLYAMDCWALSEIAKILNKPLEATYLVNEYNRISDLINKELWNQEVGMYCNKYWDGTFSNRLSPTNFYPMLAGIPSKEIAARMVHDHLENTDEFWGEYVIPSIAKNDPAFLDNDYWRGRIWGPMNFLVSEGLKRYDFYEISYEFSKKSLNLFLKEWLEENHIHENYNSLTGDGDDVKNADPVYTWGGLLGYTAIGELIEFEPWATIKLGNLSEDSSSIYNFSVNNDLYDVVKEEGFIVNKNGNKYIEASIPVIIYDLTFDEDTLSLSLLHNKIGTLKLYLPENIKLINATINGINTSFDNIQASLGISLS
ncbi:MAG TPA: trehalase family glycosidase [Clostridiaceae bacterium]